MSDRAVLLRFHEIAIKGGNRGWFEERLAINARKLIKRALPQGTPVEFSHKYSRLVIHTDWNSAVQEALSRVFGVTSYSPMRIVPTNKDKIAQLALEEFETYLQKHPMPKTFRVLTRRSEKALPETSMELDRTFGSVIKEKYPSLTVQLDDPEFSLGVEIRKENSFIWTEKFSGPSGLPVGTNGHLLCLLSGGIDSPVAAIQALKRGATTSFLHFYGTPFVGEEALEKVEDLARIVNRFQPDPLPLYVVPFGKIQERIALATNPKMRTVLYRRMMFRIASAVAKEIEALAIVTGESLGQVASQTLENLTNINASASMPVLRPLIMHDKDEIIELARKYGTFETAIRPAVDCCTLFADRHPSIRSSMTVIEEQESKFPVDELVSEALAGIMRRRVI